MNFDRVARIYRFLEYALFGASLWHCRVFFLPELQDVRSALLLGDGDGRFTIAIGKASPGIELYSVEGSGGMLRLARERIENDRDIPRPIKINFIQADLRQQLPISTAELDLIVTHFCLDCLSQMETATLAANLGQDCKPGTRWLVSEFAVPPSQPFRTIGKLLVRGLYLGTFVLTGLPVSKLPDYQHSLKAAGFSLLQSQNSLCGLLRSELWVK